MTLPQKSRGLLANDLKVCDMSHQGIIDNLIGDVLRPDFLCAIVSNGPPKTSKCHIRKKNARVESMNDDNTYYKFRSDIISMIVSHVINPGDAINFIASTKYKDYIRVCLTVIELKEVLLLLFESGHNAWDCDAKSAWINDSIFLMQIWVDIEH